MGTETLLCGPTSCRICSWATMEHLGTTILLISPFQITFSQRPSELSFQQHAKKKKKKTDGSEEGVQATASPEKCQGRAEQLYPITLLPDNLSVPFSLIANSLGLEHSDSNPTVELKIERPIQIFSYPQIT